MGEQATEIKLACRPITDADITGVIALWQQAGLTRPWNDPAADIAQARRSAEATILLAVTPDDALAGTVMVGHEGHRGWVYYLAVRGDLRRQGVGRRLMAEAEGWLTTRGLQKMHLLIRPDNQAVKTFYESLGYEVQERIMMARWLDGRPLSA